jgi:hypothetical protein
LLAKAVALVDDPHAKVRLQLALSLGESRDEKALAALARLAERAGDDGWMRAAILSAVPTRAERLAAFLASRKGAQAHHLLAPLASVTGARNQPEEIAELLRMSAELFGANAAATRVTILTGLAEGLARNRTRQPIPAKGQKALERLLKNADPEEKPLVLRVFPHLPDELLAVLPGHALDRKFLLALERGPRQPDLRGARQRVRVGPLHRCGDQP